jgi:hypothetical protein
MMGVSRLGRKIGGRKMERVLDRKIEDRKM